MVNESIWGNKANWYEYDFSSNTILLKNSGLFTTNWNLNSRELGLSKGVYRDKLNPNIDLDTSNSFWKVNGKSELLNFKVMGFIGENPNSPEIFEVNLFDDKDFNVWFDVSTETRELNNLSPKYYGKNFDYRGKWKQSKETFLNWNYGDMSGETLRNTYNTQFLNRFDYSKIVIYPVIYCSNSFTGNVYTFSIHDYFDTDNITKYPIIRSIQYRTFLECSDNVRRTFGSQIKFVSDRVLKAPSQYSNSFGDYYNGYKSYMPTSYLQVADYQYFDHYNLSKEDYIKKIHDTNALQYRMLNLTKYVESFYVYENRGSNGYGGSELRITKNIKITKEELLTEFAYLGFIVALTNASAQNGKLGISENLGIPVIEKGVTTGEILFGEEAINAPNYGWTDSENIPQYTDADDDINMNATIFNNGSYTSMKFYYLTENQFESFISSINAYSPTGEVLDKDFKGVNPTEYIQQVIYYPNLALDGIGNSQNIILGSFDTEVQGLKMFSTYGNLIRFDPINIQSYFYDFRDFAPYTTITLYTLFGTIELDSKFFIGHTISIQYCFDYLYGSGIAFILRDGVYCDMIQGYYGIKVPLTATMSGTYQTLIQQAITQSTMSQNNVNSGIVKTVVSAISVPLTIASGNPLLIAGGVAQFTNSMADLENAITQEKNIQYQQNHIAPKVGITGSITSNQNCVVPFNPFIIISRPKNVDFDIESYENTIGYACNTTGKLNEFKGLTVCANIDVSGLSCSAQIKAIIQQICRNGIYL